VSSVAALRPGRVRGIYPEGKPPSVSRWQQQLDRFVGWWLAPWRPTTTRYGARLRRIHTRGEKLQAMDAAALREALRPLRQSLRRDGLQDKHCIEAFALIRELAFRTLGMRHYDVQLLGGWVMLRGKVAEMQTGEGKTLTATLPAATAALAGIPVHVITVNDYLVRRDADWMRPLYQALGLTVGSIVEGMSEDQRRQAYACDIVYCTNKQLVFDYLRDRMARGGLGQLRLRLDGLLGEQGLGKRLLLRGLCFAILDEADSVLIDEARTPLIISRSGCGNEEEQMYREALRLAATLTPGIDYRLEMTRREVEVTAAGREKLASTAAVAGGLWRGARRREELVTQALYADQLLQRDRHYLVKDGKVQIIDEYTGRLMPDRSWERGLHQLVELKEGCDVTAPVETLARISFQRFFRRYLHLSGMTGTATEVASELWSVYRLRLVTVPTYRPPQRRRLRGKVFRRLETKWTAVVEQISTWHGQGIPVLVGTTSVQASEHLSALLHAADLPHQVLNARHDADEAAVVAQAGQPGAITVATNMAGRGTDIALGDGVDRLGGLHVLATERHDAGRIDRQLYGRCGRQGDPGAYGYMVSLEDELIQSSPWRWLLPLLPEGLASTGVVGRWLVRRAQRGAERRHARTRHDLLRFDEQVGKMLAFSGRME